MSFEDIAGNGRAKTILRIALGRGRVPNSLLFAGPAGVGKTRTARTLAQALNCLRLKDDACGECGPCRAIAERRFPDVLEYEIQKKSDKKDDRDADAPDRENPAAGEDDAPAGKKEKSSTVISIAQMKELRRLALLNPMTGRRRVFIVHEADSMSADAANCILKILEEPPLFTHIILLSDNPALILATIKSRCRILTFLPVSDEDVERALRAQGVEEGRARITALIVRGNMERALDLDWEEIQAERREAWALFADLLGPDPAALARRFASSTRGAARQELPRMLELLSAFGRDAALLAGDGDPRFLLNPDYEDGLRQAGVALGQERACSLVGLLNGASASLDRNGHVGILSVSFSAQWQRASDAR